MIQKGNFTKTDLDQLVENEIEIEEATRQLNQLRNPPPPARLERACSIGDGVVQLHEEDHESLIDSWSELVSTRSIIKFVPASGAASRMFKSLEADQRPSEAIDQFIGNLKRFPFFGQLRDSLEIQGSDLDELVLLQQNSKIVAHLLNSEGLGYSSIPKGLIPFHAYSDGARSALVEHLIEGAPYIALGGKQSKFHFTVSPSHITDFQNAAQEAIPSVEGRIDRQILVEFSTQNSATNTLAIDEFGNPIRQEDGSLLLRPSGHGALIDNLDQLQADVAFIKNIDNVAPSRAHEDTVLWKRLLAGYLSKLQQRTFELLDELEARPASRTVLDSALEFVHTRYSPSRPSDLSNDDSATQRHNVLDRLKRPIRVAGMVQNSNEPGGGPFWVKMADGSLTAQIVERSQVDLDQPGQREIWASSTHLNPVDLVCSLTDRQGNSFQFGLYVDPDTAFVTRKSHAGASLTALERPGLWNGAMAGWNTVFVEVPNSTFTPVKTVFDLLRPAHQP